MRSLNSVTVRVAAPFYSGDGPKTLYVRELHNGLSRGLNERFPIFQAGALFKEFNVAGRRVVIIVNILPPRGKGRPREFNRRKRK